MRIVVKQAETGDALRAALHGDAFDFVSLHGNCESDLPVVAQGLDARHVHGATSCLGAMTDQGPTQGVAGFAISDPDGAYGTALAEFSAGPRAAAAQATREALQAADRLGEMPDLVWVAATPGTEEDVLAGIEDVLGTETPIIGGSAADNTVAGDWYVCDATRRAQAGVVVSVLFPSRPVSFAYQSGYSPTEHAGIVTKASGRTINEIDGRPAMDVYRDWTGAAVPAAETDARAILSESTLWPLGRETNQLGEVPFYLLAHPALAHPDGAMELFAQVEEGTQLTQMAGTKASLIERAERVAALAHSTVETEGAPISGALMIYCGGCMLSVRDHIGEVAAGVNRALGAAPFLGAFTFGEQGRLMRVGNRHGNLMISCIIFG